MTQSTASSIIKISSRNSHKAIKVLSVYIVRVCARFFHSFFFFFLLRCGCLASAVHCTERCQLCAIVTNTKRLSCFAVDIQTKTVKKHTNTHTRAQKIDYDLRSDISVSDEHEWASESCVSSKRFWDKRIRSTDFYSIFAARQIRKQFMCTHNRFGSVIVLLKYIPSMNLGTREYRRIQLTWKTFRISAVFLFLLSFVLFELETRAKKKRRYLLRSKRILFEMMSFEMGREWRRQHRRRRRQKRRLNTITSRMLNANIWRKFEIWLSMVRARERLRHHFNWIQ